MKKVMGYVLLSVLLLSGCSKGETTDKKPSSNSTSETSQVQAKEETLPFEVELATGEYVDLPVGTTNPYEKVLLLTLDVTNLSKDTISIDAGDFALKTASGELIESHQYLNDEFKNGFTEVVKEKRTQPRKVLFYTEEIALGQGEYSLVSRKSSLDDWLETGITVKVKDYEDSKSELEKSAVAFQAYMNLALFSQESQDFLAYTVNDLELTKAAYQERWNERFFGLSGLFTFYKPTDEEKNSIYQIYQSKQLTRNEIVIEKVYDDLTTAEFKLKGKAFSQKKVVASFKVYIDENAEATKRRGIKEGLYEKDVINKFGEALDKAELQEFSDINITMKKINDKWEVEQDNRLFLDLVKGSIGG